MSILPSGLYLMGAPPSCISVPYPVGVKKAGIPAPPARIRSANVPCIQCFSNSFRTLCITNQHAHIEVFYDSAITIKEQIEGYT